MKYQCMLMILVLSYLPVVGQTQSVQSLIPIEKLLNADGTINTTTGFQGSLDVQGYSMKTGAHGEPMFFHSPKSPMIMPGDEAWQDRFGVSGTKGYPDLRAVASDGSNLYVGGDFETFAGISVRRIAKWDGTKWSSLGSGIRGFGWVRALATSGGNLYVGGYFDSVDVIAAHNIAKWNGTSWSAMGSGVNQEVRVIAATGTNVFVGGQFDTAGAVRVNHIAKWDGVNWSALGSGTDDNVFALAVHGADVYAGGIFTTAGGSPASRIARWNGVQWSGLGTGVTGTVFSVGPWVNSLQFIGSDLYVAGIFTNAGGVNTRIIAKWNGTTWSGLGTGANGYVECLVTDGVNLFVGGDFDTVSGVHAYGVAKWNGSTWTALNTSPPRVGISSMVFNWGNLYVVGFFPTSTIGGQYARDIAYWDGSSWHGMPGQGMNSPVQALAVTGNNIYAGGSFLVGGVVPVFRIGKWNDTIWTDLDGGLDNSVYALAVSGSDLYVGGDFLTTRGGVNPSVTVNHIAKWDGTSWSSLGDGVDGTVYALTVKGTDVYAGGAFLAAGAGFIVNHVAKWDGANWSALGDGFDNTVYALATNDSGVFAGGIFTLSNTFSVPYIARWNGTNWWSPGGGMNLPVFALANRGSDIYAGGMFTLAGGVPTSHIAKWDGANWSAIGGVGGGTDGTIYALAADLGQVVAGGEFGNAGGVTASNIALWNDTAWSAMGSGIDNIGRALAIRGVDIFAGGDFTSAGAKPSYFIGEWEGNKVIKKVTETYDEKPKWNMVSVALAVDNYSKYELFPTSISSAYSYQDGYTPQDILMNGVGYWLKFADSEQVMMSGYPITIDSIPVSEGWNMVGSISDPLPVTQILSDPPGIVTTQFFGFNGAYEVSEIIEPGKAYWVKARQAGMLILVLHPSTMQSSAIIRIVPTSELPPPPPEGRNSNLRSSIPNQFGLEQNYPNPFNPTTNVRYCVPVRSRVRLEVYNMLGQRIAVLVDEPKEAGYYVETLHATSLPSGIYFYRLLATRLGDNEGTRGRTYVSVKKMLLLK